MVAARPSPVRVLGGLVAGALSAWLGGQIMGEYEFEGLLPFIVGPLFGLVVAELTAAVGGWRDISVAVFCAAAAALGLLWAGRIDSGYGVEPVKSLVWVSAALGALTAYLRICPPAFRRATR